MRPFSLLVLRFRNLSRRFLVSWKYAGTRVLVRKSFRYFRGWFGRGFANRQAFTSRNNSNVVFITIDPLADFRPPPVVSIIIPVFNGLEYIRQCLESIYSSPVDTRFEVIVIDQASEDGSRQYLRVVAQRHASCRLIENTTNLGFPHAINQGAAVARGEFLAIVNSDVIVTPGWLDHLVSVMRDDPRLAVVSPVTNYVGEGLQIDSDARQILAAQATEYAHQIAGRQGVRPVVDRLVFFCVLVRRKIFDLLGGMAEVFGLGNYEDEDFCLRARIAGFTLAIVPYAFIYHYGSRTFLGQGVPHVYWMLKNETIFFERVAEFATQMSLSQRPHFSVAPIVSVVVRTRNRTALLKQALTSLTNQTFADFEVIVVNDGGEHIETLLDGFAPYLKLNYVHNEKSCGRAAALNKGLAVAKGYWITYLDDDDIVYPTHLENLAAAVAQPDVRVAYCNTNKALCWSNLQYDFVISRVPFAQVEFDPKLLLVENWIPLMSFMHAVDCVKTVGGFDEGLDIFEDWDFLIRLATLCGFYHIRRTTSEYRFRFGDIPDDSTLKSREKAIEAMRQIYVRYPAQGEEHEARRKIALDGLKQQIEEVRWIKSQNLPELKKGMLVAACLGKFPSEIAKSERWDAPPGQAM